MKEQLFSKLLFRYFLKSKYILNIVLFYSMIFLLNIEISLNLEIKFQLFYVILAKFHVHELCQYEFDTKKAIYQINLMIQYQLKKE